jgi:hypothetical protein
MDDELRSKEEISLTLLKAIGISKFSLPIWFNRFVGLKQLHLEDCMQLRAISELPPNIEVVFLG